MTTPTEQRTTAAAGSSPGFALSDEQIQIIRHPLGCHGKVLATAGSGKTTTMAERVVALTNEHAVAPGAIQVLMYNRHARAQFRHRLAAIGLPREMHPPVDTFHSYAYRLLPDMAHREDWMSNPDRAGSELRRAIQTVLDRRFPPDAQLDPTARQERRERSEQLVAHLLEPAREAIMLWKNANIPPDQAGYDADPATAHFYQEIYQEFEDRRRQARNAITYDDFLPEVLNRLEKEPELLERTAGPLQHLIVDEYQDINLAQQQLIELLASRGADLLAVGDDDQTIYEWRGARADYILGEFQNVFDNKPHRVYKLTRSFRFGYHIAQNAQNVIRHNPNRLNKDLLAHRPGQDSQVRICAGGNGAKPAAQLADRLSSLLAQPGVAPDQVRVLGRTHGQLNKFALELLRRKIPHQALGHASFLQAAETRDLLNYLRLAQAIHRPHAREPESSLLRAVMNRPNRFIANTDRERIMEYAGRAGCSLLQAMRATARPDGQPPRLTKLQNLERLADLLESIADRQPAPPAHEILRETLQRSGLEGHYTSSYGYGEAAQQRRITLQTLLDYAQATGMTVDQFLRHTDAADPAFGRPEAEQVKLMTIHTAKGLEFDYVLLPECAEGAMPTLISGGDPTYDARNPRRAPKPAEWLENERRLFYVAATRARKALYIALPDPDSEAKPSRFLEEMEPEATADIAGQLPAAMQGLENDLPGALRRWNDQHSIVRLVKQAYSLDLPEELYPAVAAVQLSRAEKPFGYSRQYDRPHRPSRADREQNLTAHLREYMLQSVMSLNT